SKPAVACYTQAERFDPENPRWLYLHGAEVLADNPSEGIALLRRALARARPASVRSVVLFRLALVLIENGDLDEAEAHLPARRPLDGGEGGARTHFALGLLAIAREDRAAAREHLGQVANYPACQKRACGLLATLAGPDREEVRRHRQRADQLPPDLPWPDPF